MPRLYSLGILNVDKKQEFPPRAAEVAAAVDRLDANLLVLTEAKEVESDLARRMTPKTANDWAIGSDYVNVVTLYRRDLFAPVKHAGKSSCPLKMPTSPFVRWRYGSAVLLKDLDSGLVFLLVAVHYSNGGESSHSDTDQILQAQSSIKQLKDWGVWGKYPVIYAGDLNNKLTAPKGPAGVLAKEGLVDTLVKLRAPVTIDRALASPMLVPESWTSTTVPARVTDHKKIARARYTVPSVTPPPPKPAPSRTRLQELEAVHGRITRLDVSAFEKARLAGYSSRYVAEVQVWMGRPVDCSWSLKGAGSDQEAFDAWRHREFPDWPRSDYTGASGVTSLTRLRNERKGGRSLPIVD